MLLLTTPQGLHEELRPQEKQFSHYYKYQMMSHSLSLSFSLSLSPSPNSYSFSHLPPFFPLSPSLRTDGALAEQQSEDDQERDSEQDPPNWQQLVGREVLASLTPHEIKRQEVINGEAL